MIKIIQPQSTVILKKKLKHEGECVCFFWFQFGFKLRSAGTLSPLECLSFANTIQADLPTYAFN